MESDGIRNMVGDRKTERDRALWRRYRMGAATGATPGAPDPALIASYLDGGLDDSERAAVEAWLAATPDALDALIGTQRSLADGARPIVPPALIRGAKALVVPAASRQRPADRSRGGSALASLLRTFEWSGVAAAVIVVCVAGFQLGLSSAAPTTEIEIALDQGPAFELAAPGDGPFDPYGPDPFGNGGNGNGET